MKAIHERYGHQRAAVLALQAGADMVMALGSREDQLAALQSIETALAGGAVTPRQAERSCARLDALAARYPSEPRPYAREQHDDDDALMRRAWALGLTRVGDAQPPASDRPLRVFTQRAVPSDGVSEAGLDAAQVQALFAGFKDVDFVQLDRLGELDWGTVPRDGRFTVLASNHRQRYGAPAATWRPDLHLALWNPFQVLDVAAPAVVTWGYAEGALAAVRAWLEGRAQAPGRAPVPLSR
jgi:beta-N-acetylhexosaminidase